MHRVTHVVTCGAVGESRLEENAAGSVSNMKRQSSLAEAIMGAGLVGGSAARKKNMENEKVR